MDPLTALLIEIEEIARQQQDPTLSHSDQQLLDQAWEDIDRRISEIEDMSSIDEEDEDDDDGYQTPPRIAPPPPETPPRPRQITIPQMTQEELDYWNSMDDDRSECGCRDGCMYCTETPSPRYDPAGEV